MCWYWESQMKVVFMRFFMNKLAAEILTFHLSWLRWRYCCNCSILIYRKVTKIGSGKFLSEPIFC